MADDNFVELVDATVTDKETPGGILIEVSTHPSFAKVKIWFPKAKINILENGGIEIPKWLEKAKNEEEKVLVDMGEALCTL